MLRRWITKGNGGRTTGGEAETAIDFRRSSGDDEGAIQAIPIYEF
jgi:hypothetical protein